MRFTFIDKIVSLEKGASIVVHKNLSMAEEYLADHFPKFPVMPGVLVVETMTQAAAWLMRVTTDFSHSTITLKETKATRFKNFVAPGQTLVVTCKVKKWEGDECVVMADGVVDGVSVTSARITLRQVNLGDKSPALKANDEKMIEHFRSHLPQIWKPTEEAASA